MRGVAGVAGKAVAGARGGARAASGFSVGTAGEATGASGAAAASAPAAVGLSLLALQENGDRAGRDAAARRRAACLLDELQGLQAELLGGGRDPGRLARLAALQTGDEGTDPGLREAVRAVALRARIELARRGLHADGNRSASVP